MLSHTFDEIRNVCDKNCSPNRGYSLGQDVRWTWGGRHRKTQMVSSFFSHSSQPCGWDLAGGAHEHKGAPKDLVPHAHTHTCARALARSLTHANAQVHTCTQASTHARTHKGMRKEPNRCGGPACIHQPSIMAAMKQTPLRCANFLCFIIPQKIQLAFNFAVFGPSHSTQACRCPPWPPARRRGWSCCGR